jgi:D-alanyl-D-alanine-carboxypeptidase/D-alanyl-D-alanine-endopeptidase
MTVMKIVCAFFLIACLIGLAQEPTSDTAADIRALEAEIKGALVNRIDNARNAVGIVVGILTPQGRRYVAHGLSKKGSGVQPNLDTIFEIGSITKVFTSLLLADMVERGEVKLDDPIARYLPSGRTVPSRNGRQITLADLATHTSGLPRDASNLDLAQTNPFATYGPPQLYVFLSAYQLPRDPGGRFEYSNVGASLLGHILTLRTGATYEQLLQTRILKPLGMNDTTITLSESRLKRIATGHDGALDPLPLWGVDALVGAGSIRSTADDMLTFAAAQLGLVDHPLKAAMARMLSITRPGVTTSMDQHLGWAQTRGGVLFHNGRRGGFSSALTIRPNTQRAVVVLANSVQSVNDIAFHGVNPDQRLRTFSPPRKEISLPEAELERYVGKYDFTPAISIQITREGARLFGQVTSQPKFELYAEQESKFFVKVVDGQLSFLKDDSGAVTGLTLHQNGANQPARRMQ